MSVHTLTEKQRRRRANERANKRDRRNLRALKGTWPARDPDYLAWLRTQECTLAPRCMCCSPTTHLSMRIVEAAHTGPHGISQKAPDCDAIPLCRWAHQEAKDAQGKSRTWFEDHGLDRAKVIAWLHARYEQERAA